MHALNPVSLEAFEQLLARPDPKDLPRRAHVLRWGGEPTGGNISGETTRKKVTTMSMLFRRSAIIPVWLVVFGLFALFGSPMVFATGVVLLLVAGVALTIMLVLWKELPPTIAVMTAPDPPLATLPSADFVPNSWPNSGFRNSRQRGTRGERRDSGER